MKQNPEIEHMLRSASGLMALFSTKANVSAKGG
jgi:hypothetical protein